MSTTFSSSIFQSIRPPTPPHEHENDLDLEACETGLALLDSKHFIYNTPDDSPNSTTESAGKLPEERSAKRVGFVLIPNNIAKSTRTKSSQDDLRPKRSILKQSSHNLSSDHPSSDTFNSTEESDIPTMLEHMIKGLASQDFSARYDAYMSINGCLKTYKDMPGKQSLIERMSVLDGYLRRDLGTDLENGVRASQMVTEALKFVTSLCWFPETKSVMTAGFQVFLLNHAITVLGKEETPKLLANLYLYFLSIQTFPPRVMSQEKITRILSVLKGVTARIQGRQCVAHRLAIYKRLIGQAKAIMANQAEDWVEDMFNNMLSKTKEIRERALTLGLFAAQCYGGSPDVSVANALRRLMNSKHAENAERKYIDDVIARLQGWLDSKQDTIDIPSIWSVVILLLRSKPHYPERWEHFSSWLKLIQGCLNINDSRTRGEANKAWIRLIYTLSPNVDTSKSMSSLLFRPLKKQLERQEREKDSSGQLRKNVDGAYITLLYYAFRPGCDHATLDRYWNEYIVPVFSLGRDMLIEDEMACRILTALFNGPQQGWQSHRALEATIILPEELPRLDPKWLRSRAMMISDVLRVHLDKLVLSDRSTTTAWKHVWTAWYDAVKLAGAKEIILSPDIIGVVVAMLNTCRKHIDSIQDDVEFGTTKFGQAAWLTSSALSRLGAAPFLEERVLDLGDNSDLLVAPDRAKQSSGRTCSALTILIQFLTGLLDRLPSLRIRLLDASIPATISRPHLSAIIQLMLAGFKGLPMDVRHSSSGQKNLKILDRLQQTLANEPVNSPDTFEQLFLFSQWYSRRLEAVPVTPLKIEATIIESTSVSIPEDANNDSIARPLPELASSDAQSQAAKHEKDHRPKTKSLVKKEITTPEASSRRTRGSLFHEQPRLRHDNSQIEFASIDSSPSISRALESQFLTDRQKEVKDRQREESDALFRDISSSSGPKSRTENTPRLQLSGRDRAKIGAERLGSSSPILPPADSTVAFLGSSPTPRHRRLLSDGDLGLSSDVRGSDGTSMMHFSLDDPPSSPPAETSDLVNTGMARQTFEDEIVDQEIAPPKFGLHIVGGRPSSDLSDVIEGQEMTSELLMPLGFTPLVDDNVISGVSESSPTQATDADYLVEESSSPAQDLVAGNGMTYHVGSEDEELISSQIGQDLRHASQDAVMVEMRRRDIPSPVSKRRKDDSSQRIPLPEPEIGLNRSRKRMYPESAENEDDSRQSPKRAKMVSESGIQTNEDIVADLQCLLEMAKTGMTSQQGLVILGISAQLTQLAVKAVQGET